MSSYCGLVDAKIRTSDKDLPVINHLWIAHGHSGPPKLGDDRMIGKK